MAYNKDHKKTDNSFLGYETPVDVDNESLIIATAIADPDIRRSLFKKTSFEQFRSPECRTIFWAMQDIETKKLDLNVDAILLQANYCPSRTVLTFEGIDKIIKNFPPTTTANIDSHVEKLADDFAKAKILDETVNRIVKVCMDSSKKLVDVQDSVNYMQRTLDTVRSSTVCEFMSVSQLTSQFLSEKDKGTSKRTTGFRELDYVLTDGLKEKTVTIICGLCISGDTVIPVARGNRVSCRSYTIEELYHLYNNIKFIPYQKHWDNKFDTHILALNNQGYLQKHKVKAVISSGDKHVFKVTTESGKTIKSSVDHKYRSYDNMHQYIDADGFISLKDLKVGDKIVCRDLSYKESKPKAKKVLKQRRVVYSIPYHKYGVTHTIAGKNYKRANYARINYEAYLNGMDAASFIKILRQDEARAKTLIYLDPAYDIHHKDGNADNDSIDNYEVLTHKEHSKRHSEERYSAKYFNHISVTEEVITSIDYVGIEKTYDIICEDPFHNFVANDFIVHNSSMGKSSLSLSMIKNLSHKKQPTGLFALEMNSMAVYTKFMAYNTGLPVSSIVKPYDKMTKVEQELFSYQIEKNIMNEIIHVCDKPQTLKNIEQQTMMLQDLLRVEYIPVYIDLFGKIRDLRGSDNFARDYEHQLNEVQDMAKRLNVPLILVAQINRAVMQRKNKRPTMQDLKNAGAFEEVADLILGVHRPFYNPENAMQDDMAYVDYWGETGGGDDEFQVHSRNNAAVHDPSQDIAEVIVMKQRNGQANKIVNFYFNPKNTCYEPISREHQKLINQTKDMGEGGF